jgi:hypothetical protein
MDFVGANAHHSMSAFIVVGSLTLES